MAKIIEFPLSIEREWSRIRSTIKEMMEKDQVPEEVMNYVLSWHKEMYVSYKEKSRLGFNITLECLAPKSADVSCMEVVEGAVKELSNHFSRLAAEMMLEMTDLKIELEIIKVTSESPTHPPRS